MKYLKNSAKYQPLTRTYRVKLETGEILNWHGPKYLLDEQITKYFDNLAVMDGGERMFILSQ